MDDRELLTRCGQGENAAWTLFLERYDAFLKFIIRRALPAAREHELDDLHDEVVAWLLADSGRVLQTFRGESKLSSWLGVIVARRVKRALGSKVAKEGGTVSLDALSVAAATELSQDRRRDAQGGGPRPEALDRLRSALGELPERDRRLLEGCFLENRSYEDLGRELGIKEASIGQLLFRAKQRLKKKLGGEKFLESLSGILLPLLSFFGALGSPR